MSLWAQNNLMPVFLSPNPGKLIQIFFQNFNFSDGDSDGLKKLLQIKGWVSQEFVWVPTGKLKLQKNIWMSFPEFANKG